MFAEGIVKMEFTGIGLYTLQEAERLTGADPREARRWLFGYKHANGYSEPLWRTQMADLDEKMKVIGFRDLLELRIVKAFVEKNVPLQVIRVALTNARKLFGDYPFTANRFLTDGRSIFHEAIEGETQLTDLAKQQLVFEQIIRPTLYAGIEFTATGKATRWYPTKNKVVVLDPEVSFGKPILAEYGVRTDVIAQAVKVEKSKRAVAAIYEIPLSAVEAAVKFERLAA
ncbi:DUF433 domain-containing protein [Herbaspirillum seropedicae]|uniref:DUF433 domain-containing protein n=1 Tax=Herbaspirillum seropedicae TaxID=964 RepID=UPI003D981464